MSNAVKAQHPSFTIEKHNKSDDSAQSLGGVLDLPKKQRFDDVFYRQMSTSTQCSRINLFQIISTKWSRTSTNASESRIFGFGPNTNKHTWATHPTTIFVQGFLLQ